MLIYIFLNLLLVFKKKLNYCCCFPADYNDSTIHFEEQLGTHLTLKGNKIHLQVMSKVKIICLRSNPNFNICRFIYLLL